MSDNRFDYYNGAEGDQFSFIRIPKLMLFDSKFSDLSLGAIVLYGLLLDRMNLSIKHGWLDENGHVYIRYKIKEIQMSLNLSENTATKYLMELEKIGVSMEIIKSLGKILIKALIWLIQIPLTVIYFVLSCSFFGSVISGLGWLFGVMIFGATICFWAFGEFDSWYQVATAFALSTAIVILPGWLTEFIGEGILLLKQALSELAM